MHKKISGKPRMGLIPPAALEEVAKVLTFGTEKYTPHSWMAVPNEYYIDAALRHIIEARKGTARDVESKEYHLAHAITNLMFLLEKQVFAGETSNVMSILEEAARARNGK